MGQHGIHHVTAIAGPAQRNLDFYTHVLGLRLVKKTVNYDDPGSYHFYFADSHGRPGSILTFFPWQHAAPGRAGVGSVHETALRVPEASLGYWADRFSEMGVEHGVPGKRFGQNTLTFKDLDGTGLALVGIPGCREEATAWMAGGIPSEHAIQGLDGTTLVVEDGAATGAILTDILGFREVGREGSLVRYESGSSIGGTIDIRNAGGFLPGRMGAGSYHHVAFRAEDDAAQARMVQRLAEHHDIHATEQRDRYYFRSVYFREPGGIVFEIATDGPGFTVDETMETLGSSLKLPRSLESRRKDIENSLPELA